MFGPLLPTLLVIQAAALDDHAYLKRPEHLEAAAEPIDVQRDGHAAPFYGDVDGDGLKDLLVGEFRDGRLRVYRNVGTVAQPRFDGYEFFEAGGELGRVPTG